MAKKTTIRRRKKREGNILKRISLKTMKKFKNRFMKKINLLTITKRYKHKHRGG